MTDRDPTPAPGSRSELISAPVDAAIDLIAKAMAAASISRSAFVQLAGVANLYELKAAEVALKRSQREDIRQFAREMLADHKKMGSELNSFLGATNDPQSPPEQLDKPFQALLDDLHGAADADFDHRYVVQQQAAHSAAVTLFPTYYNSGTDGALRNLARLALPVLEHHLAMADELVGGSR